MPGDNWSDMETPTGAMEALTGLPTLDLVIQGEERSAVCWSLESATRVIHHTSQGHSSRMMRLQRSDPIFDVM
jgi:hypothetical protein